MSTLRRLALGFPLTWSHRRKWSLKSLAHPGAEEYFIEWDPSNSLYGEEWTAAPRDQNGVLLSGPQRYYHPIRIAQFALHRYGVFCRTSDPNAKADVLDQATWFRDRQTGNIEGSYPFEFPWNKYGAGAGWCSAMAQGQAISVLLRAATLEPQQGFADAAMRAALPFLVDVSHGGVVWQDGEDVFLEEIGNAHAPHVLNGCIYALWGLWELWKRSEEGWIGVTIERCERTLLRWLDRYDTGWWTLYSLMQSSANRPHLATLKYHAFHVAQMHVLSAMFGKPAFGEAGNRWDTYAMRPDCRARLISATLGSIPERVLRLDTVPGGART